jgi:hypothetical protein
MTKNWVPVERTFICVGCGRGFKKKKNTGHGRLCPFFDAEELRWLADNYKMYHRQGDFNWEDAQLGNPQYKVVRKIDNKVNLTPVEIAKIKTQSRFRN